MKKMKKKICICMMIMCMFCSVFSPEAFKADEYDLTPVAEWVNSRCNNSYYGYVTFDQLQYIVYEINGVVCCVGGGSLSYDADNNNGFNISVMGYSAGDAGTQGAFLFVMQDGVFVKKSVCASPKYFAITNVSKASSYGFESQDAALEYFNSNENAGIKVIASSQAVVDDSGNTYLDIVDNDAVYKSSGLTSDLGLLLGFMGAFPGVVGALLAWLPPEYQVLVYTSFGAILTILVVKTVRG